MAGRKFIDPFEVERIKLMERKEKLYLMLEELREQEKDINGELQWIAGGLDMLEKINVKWREARGT